VARKRSRFGRAWRAALIVALACAAASALAVLTLRWVNPRISSFMVQAWAGSLFERGKSFRLDHR
jgi:hypothetical protein